MAIPVYVSKQLGSIASSSGIGVLSTAATPVYTANAGTNAPGNQRRLTVWSSAGDLSTLIVTITGRDDTGNTVIEQLVDSSATGLNRVTVQDFASVTAVSASSVPELPVNIGWTTIAGTPWKSIDTTRTPIDLGINLTFSTTANAIVGQIDLTADDVMQPYKKPLTTLSTANTAISFIPAVTVSTALSSATTTNTFGLIDRPAAYWRLTLTSTSSTAGIAFATAVQAGT